MICHGTTSWQTMTGRNSFITKNEQIEIIVLPQEIIFTRARFDVGTNSECYKKWITKEERAAYGQSFPTPIHLKDEVAVELPVLYKYGSFTTLPFLNSSN